MFVDAPTLHIAKDTIISEFLGRALRSKPLHYPRVLKLVMKHEELPYFVKKLKTGNNLSFRLTATHMDSF